MVLRSWKDICDYIRSILSVFLKHCYAERNQAATYNMEKETAGTNSHEKTAALDYSENYTCCYQDEFVVKR